MANHEACELYIEQQIEEGLEDGKTPYTIGKELSTWIARLFEVKIPRETLKKRAQRKKASLGTNVPIEENETISDSNSKLEKLEKTHGGARPGAGRKPKQPDPELTWTCTECDKSYPMAVESCSCWSDNRDADADQKQEPESIKATFTEALRWSGAAIATLSSISSDDPNAEKALNDVIEWCSSRLKQLNRGGA